MIETLFDYFATLPFGIKCVLLFIVAIIISLSLYIICGSVQNVLKEIVKPMQPHNIEYRRYADTNNIYVF